MLTTLIGVFGVGLGLACGLGGVLLVLHGHTHGWIFIGLDFPMAAINFWLMRLIIRLRRERERLREHHRLLDIAKGRTWLN